MFINIYALLKVNENALQNKKIVYFSLGKQVIELTT